MKKITDTTISYNQEDFEALIGETISYIDTESVNELHLIFSSLAAASISTEQYRQEYRYFHTFESPKEFIGAKIEGFRFSGVLIERPYRPYDNHRVVYLYIITTKGEFEVVFHQEYNRNFTPFNFEVTHEILS
jgi:hypothetical protein